MPDAPQPPFQFPEELDAQVTITVDGDSAILRALSASGTPPTGSGMGVPAHGTAPTGLPDFVLHRLIGIGGFGEVWEAEQQSLGRSVALKRLRPAEELPTGARADASRLFELEARLTAQLDHPNIVPVHGLVWDDAGTPHLCMKLVRGRAWDELLKAEHRQLNPEEFLTRHLGILISVSQAVAFAHSRGVVHRDLKPSQIMVGEFGEVQLLDWGLAIHWGGGGEKSATPITLPTPSNASSPSGTPAFMAPEQTGQDARNVGPWTDVYLLGACLFFLLTGRPPHGGSTAREAFGRAAMGEVIPFTIAAPDRVIPEDLGRIALRAMEPEAKDRHPDVPAFIHDLQAWLSGASKRRESERITHAAEKALAGSASTHGQFAHWTGQLGNARGLWPENPAIAALEDRLHEQWGSFALHGGDFALARAEAEQVRGQQRRAQLLDRVVEAERIRAARLRQRRIAIGAAAVALAAAAILGGLFITERETSRREMESANLQLQAERDIARRERDRSIAVRNDSERLVGLILDDLTNQMDRIGRLDTMENAARETIRYFEQLTPEERTALRVRQGASAWFTLASAKFNQGAYAESLEALDTAEQVALGLLATIPEDAELRQGIASIRMLRASVHDQQGDHARASKQRSLSAETYAHLLQNNQLDEAAIGNLLILNYDELAQRIRLGDLDTCRALIEQTLPIIAQARERFPTNIFVAECIESFLLKAADAMQLSGEYDLALEYVRQAQAAIPSPTDAREEQIIARQKRAALANSITAQILAGRGDRAEAITLMDEAITAMRRLREEAPSDRSISHNLHTFLNQKAAWQYSKGDLAGSSSTIEELATLTRQFHASYPDDLENMIAFSFALEGQITVLLQLRDAERALPLMDERAALIRRMETTIPDGIRTQDAQAKSAEHRAILAELQQDYDAAERWWLECIEVHRQLLEREPTRVIRRENILLSLSRLGLLFYNLQEPENCERIMTEALRTAAELHEEHPGHGDYLHAIITAENTLAVLQQQRGEREAALSRILALEELAAKFLHGDDSAAAVAESWLPVLHFNLACAYSGLGKYDEGFAVLAKAATSGRFPRADFEEDDDLRPLRESDPERFRGLLPAE